MTKKKTKAKEKQPSRLVVLVTVLTAATAVIGLIAAIAGGVPPVLEAMRAVETQSAPTPTNTSEPIPVSVQETLSSPEPTETEIIPSAPAIEPTFAPINHDFSQGWGNLILDETGSPCTTQLDNGTAKTTVTGEPADIEKCHLVISDQVNFNELRYAQANLLALDSATGEYIAHFLSLGFASPSGEWSASCGIRWGSAGYQLFMAVMDDAAVEMEAQVEALPEQWYRVRLDVSPETGEIKCSVNEVALEVYTLTSQRLAEMTPVWLRITTTRIQGSTGSFWTDDIFVNQ